MTEFILCPITHTYPEPKLHICDWKLTFDEAMSLLEFSDLPCNALVIDRDKLKGIKPFLDYEATYTNLTEAIGWARYHHLHEGSQAISKETDSQIFVSCIELVGETRNKVIAASLMWYDDHSKQIVVENA